MGARDPVYLVGRDVTWFHPEDCTIRLACIRSHADWVAGFTSARVKVPGRGWSPVPGPACMYCLMQAMAAAWGIWLEPGWYRADHDQYKLLKHLIVFKGLSCSCSALIRGSQVCYLWGPYGLTGLKCRACGSMLRTTAKTNQARERREV